MSKIERKVLQLVEHRPGTFPVEEINREDGVHLWKMYGDRIRVEFPSPVTNNRWTLTSLGWVGYVPVSETLAIHISPKFETANLFRMWGYAYNINFEILAGLFQCGSLAEFYEQLAYVLGSRILDRSRQGLFREYVTRKEELAYIAGRLDLRNSIEKPLRHFTLCEYEEHTVDAPDNQIVAWTLFIVARSGFCSGRTLELVKAAYRSLAPAVSLVPFAGADCVARFYNRLNQDYGLTHALCRFFLENSGPLHKPGQNSMFPFLVYMPLLFERFLAQWLKTHLPSFYRLKTQERVNVTESGELHFRIDMVVYGEDYGDPLLILDTKYKESVSPDASDIAQVVAYAAAKRCSNAVLVYPSEVSIPLDANAGPIHVRTIGFPLEGDIEVNGLTFLAELLREFS